MAGPKITVTSRFVLPSDITRAYDLIGIEVIVRETDKPDVFGAIFSGAEGQITAAVEIANVNTNDAIEAARSWLESQVRPYGYKVPTYHTLSEVRQLPHSRSGYPALASIQRRA